MRTYSWFSTSESQTVTLNAGIRYRHWVRWVTPAGVTRTIVSGDYIPKAP